MMSDDKDVWTVADRNRAYKDSKEWDKNQNEFKSFKFGNYKIKFCKKIFKYELIIGVIIFVGYPYLNLNIPTHSLTDLKNFKETK